MRGSGGPDSRVEFGSALDRTDEQPTFDLLECLRDTPVIRRLAQPILVEAAEKPQRFTDRQPGIADVGALAGDLKLELGGAEAVAAYEEGHRCRIDQPPRGMRVRADVLSEATGAASETHASIVRSHSAARQFVRQGSHLLTTGFANSSPSHADRTMRRCACGQGLGERAYGEDRPARCSHGRGASR